MAYELLTSPAMVAFAPIILFIAVTSSLGPANKEVPVSTIPGQLLAYDLPLVEMLYKKIKIACRE